MQRETKQNAKATELSYCPHVDMVLLSWEEIKATKAKCHDCGKMCPKSAWLCLFQDCGYVGCGSKLGDHSSVHQEKEGHRLMINLHKKRFWCSECKCEVLEHRNRPAFILRKYAIGFEPNARSGAARTASAAAVAAPLRIESKDVEFSEEPEDADEDEDPEPESLGLTGLRNLGNTCYMNAALQAISNCRQLTRFFLDCPGLVRPSRFATRSLATPLCTAYAGLLAELWSPQRHTFVSPHLLLQSMRQAHPAFRGWTQQDSQEFLRCFMDQLHEELKRPVLVPPTSALGDEDGGCCSDGRDVSGGGATSDKADSNLDAPLVGPASAPSISSCATVTSASGAAVGSAADDAVNVSTATAAADASFSAADPGATASAISGTGKSGKRRIRCFKSIISDTFNGSLVSTVQCNTCERLSSTLEVFQDLSLPIPSGEHLTAVQKKSAAQGGYAQGTWWMVSVLMWPLSWMRGFLAGPRVTLQDCLAAFFSNDDLKGDNMYHCEKCCKLRNGVKYSRISRLPEMLTVHLKRFRHDFLFSTKISAHVDFPIEGLDMKPYLHRDCRARQTVYDLTGVVCHHGSTLGGHYTAYALNHAGMQWYEFDDSRVRRVDVTAVENCQAYVLFYRKRDEWVQQLRLRVNEMMELRQDATSLMPFYISRPWLNKFNTFGDPGPISNEDFLCPHQLLSPHFADCADSMVMRLPYNAWDLLMNEFGGGPTVNRLGLCPECAADLQRSRDRAASELAVFKREMEFFQRTSGSVYAISMRWFRRWEAFAMQRDLDPPGPIDNSGIAVRRETGISVRPNSDYAQVSSRIWRYLLQIYSGGPEVRLGSIGGRRRSSSASSSSRSSCSNSGASDSEAAAAAAPPEVVGNSLQASAAKPSPAMAASAVALNPSGGDVGDGLGLLDDADKD